MLVKKIWWFVFIFLALSIGLYPFSYFFIKGTFGLLSTKSPLLIQNIFWHSAFYLHIVFGGIALLMGWSQFSLKQRTKRIARHRLLGKVYISSVFISGTSALYIACFSDGGMITHIGFGLLAFLWLLFTVLAFINVQNLNFKKHGEMMLRSYSLCFAAVTLRLLIPLFVAALHMSFLPSYKIISWLCWVPNLIYAEWLINIKNRKLKLNPEFLKTGIL